MNKSTLTFKEMQTPLDFLNTIYGLEYQIQNNIHDLIWQYGKLVNDGDYEISLYDRHIKSYCQVRSRKGEPIKLKKAKILCPAQCQVRGHLLLVTTDDKLLSFLDLNHQEYNVYACVHSKVEDMVKRKQTTNLD